jgi:[ribosomal protein S5]-alanine N-acetyltransferase
MPCSLVQFPKKYLTQEYINWLNDPVLMRYSEQRHLTHDIASCSQYADSFNGKDNLLYAVVDNHSQKHVGNINAYVDRFNQTADVGILISEGGHGYGLCAWKQMFDLLFSAPISVRRITAATMSVNLGMIRIFEQSGMSFEYTRLRHFHFEEEFVDLVGYYKEAP